MTLYIWIYQRKIGEKQDLFIETFFYITCFRYVIRRNIYEYFRVSMLHRLLHIYTAQNTLHVACVTIEKERLTCNVYDFRHI